MGVCVCARPCVSVHVCEGGEEREVGYVTMFVKCLAFKVYFENLASLQFSFI